MKNGGLLYFDILDVEVLVNCAWRSCICMMGESGEQSDRSFVFVFGNKSWENLFVFAGRFRTRLCLQANSRSVI